MKSYLRKYSIFLISIIAISCGTWVGNPDDKGKDTSSRIEFVVNGTPPSLNGFTIPVTDINGQKSGDFKLKVAHVVLGEIELKKDSESETEIEFEGPFVCDLLTNTLDPAPAIKSVPLGNYKELEVELLKWDDDEIALPQDHKARNKSIYLAGTYIPINGSSQEITMNFDSGEEFIFNNDGSGIETLQNSELSFSLFTGKTYLFRLVAQNQEPLG